VVPRFLAGGALVPRPSRRTMSSAMDVGDPSNVSRIAALYGCRPFPPADPAALDRLRGALGGHLTAVSFDDRATRDAIRRVRRATGTVLDPHTAVGWLALERALADAGSTAARGRTPVVLATAHPAKFGEVIEPVIGEPVPLPPRLAERLDLPTHTEPLAADPAAFADYLRALPHGLQRPGHDRRRPKMPSSANVKERMVRIIEAQPEDSSFDEILHELAFARMIERGLDDVDQGRTVSHEEVRREVESWGE
jgi:hypothetical protein